MKKALCVFLAVLLLLAPMGCGERKEPVPTGTAEVETPTTTASAKQPPEPPPEPTLTQNPGPTSMQTPAPTPIPIPTPLPESVSVDMELTDDEWLTLARDCLVRAQKAMEPVMGSTPVDGEMLRTGGYIWRRMDGCRKLRDWEAELNNAFTKDISTQIFDACAPLLLEKGDGVYIRSDCLEVLGWPVCTTDVETAERFYYDGSGLYAYGMAGEHPNVWKISVEQQRDTGHFLISGCVSGSDEIHYAPAWVPWAGHGTYGPWDLSAFGEPLSIHGNADYSDMLTYDYENFSISFIGGMDAPFETGSEDWQIANVTVTGRGIPNERGIEVGDPLKKVQRAYPGIMEMDEENSLYFDPPSMEFVGAISISFDENDNVSSYCYIYPIN